MPTKYSADVGIIGGTGVYDYGLFSDKKNIKVYTPYGAPSDLITIGKYAHKKVAFIPRHGKGHRIPPHRINNRANIWALKELGVKRIIAPSAVGSIKYEYKPGDIAIPNQFIDFTKGREYTFYDGGEVCHISLAEPFCPELRDLVINYINKLNYNFHKLATYVCVEGPRFSTKAESHFFRDAVKGDIVGMTLVPECPLAREAQMCYVSISTITDYDAWADLPVSSKEVLEVLDKNSEKTKKLIAELIPAISLKRTKCSCGHALEGALL
jgi:5'-methylthioadenosine phosphorylase